MDRRWVVLALGVAAAVPVAVAVADDSRHTAVGGGQVELTADQEPRAGEGPGDTITFSARQLAAGSDAAEGEVQEVDRVGAFAGRVRSVFHGKVVCMHVKGNMAAIVYRPRSENAPDDEIHQLVVTDNGEGSTDDTIIRDKNTQTPCVISTPDDPELAVARGDVQIHHGP